MKHPLVSRALRPALSLVLFPLILTAAAMLTGCDDDDGPVAPGGGPVAVVAPDSATALPGVLVTFDPTGSHHPSGELHAVPYRWSTDRGPWSNWTASRDTFIAFDALGEHLVHLEVRDTAGRIGAAAAVVRVEVPAMASPDELVAAFDQAYELRNHDYYRELLSDDFLFVTTEDETYGLDVEMAITSNLFTGTPGTGTGGTVVPGIADIVAWLAPEGEWAAVDAAHPRFGGTGAQQRTFSVALNFSPDGAAYYFWVRGMARFYVVAMAETNGWRILGIEDFTGFAKPAETVTWTEVKDLYREGR
ncbi:MAG: hypothetical protein R6X25_01255 [Candidatus Krumholzibacteriia bacterium]